jgi:hypothetical protein
MGHAQVTTESALGWLAMMEAYVNRRKVMLGALFASIALALAGLIGLAGHPATPRDDDDDE